MQPVSCDPPGDAVSDNSLLRRYRQGDETAAADLYHRYQRRIREIARRNCPPELKNHLDADDLTQSVFRTFFDAARRGVYQVPAGKDLWNLLLVIALNKIRAKGVYHRAAKRDIRMMVDQDVNLPWISKNQANDPGDAYFIAVVRESLEQLSEQHRQIIQLRIEGYEVEEIARQVGRAKRTIERTLQELRTRLAALLEEQ